MVQPKLSARATLYVSCIALLCACILLSKPAFGFSLAPQPKPSKLIMSSSSTSSETKGPPFALNAKLSVLPEKRQAWLQQIKDNQKCTRENEPGNLQFSVSEDVDTPNTFYLHEQFVDEAAFDAHCQSPHFALYDEFCKTEKPFAPGGEAEVFIYSPLEEGEHWADAKREIRKTAFCVTVNLYPKAEVREEFLQVIANNKQGTDETEPLALQYTFGESATNTFHFHEQYCGEQDGKEGFDAHASSPHFADWETFVGTDPFAKPPEVYFSKIIED